MKAACLILLVNILVCCKPALHITTTSNAKQLWQQHKRIAIIPLRITSRDNEQLTKNDYIMEMQNMMKLSFSIQNNIYQVLQNQFGFSNLSVNIMPIDSTTEILAQSGIRYSNLPTQNINQLCSLLHVDAVIAGEVEFFNPGNSLLSLVPNPGIEKAIVWLQIFDKSQKKAIWTFKETNTAKGYDENFKRSRIINGSNEEYLVAYMFDKAMKILPYIIKSPIKRHY
jgi:hypothetical protein